MTVVFLHGAGTPGAAGWPRQSAERNDQWTFLDRAPKGDHPERDAERLLAVLARPGDGHLVATSYGACAAVIAAQKRPDLVRSLVLFEPACFDLARGKPAVEEHIAALAPVYAVADNGGVSDRDFSRRFSEAMGVQPPELSDGEMAESVGQLRALSPPWGTSILRSVGLPAETLVVTGGWSPLFDQAAQALVALGAAHIELAGAGHGAHKDARANEVLRRFWSELAPAEKTGQTTCGG